MADLVSLYNSHAHTPKMRHAVYLALFMDYLDILDLFT
jgi:hypothetical protein